MYLKYIGYIILLLGYFYTQILRNSPSAVKMYLETDYALSSLQYSNLSAAFFYSYALVQLPAGLLLDKHGPRRIAFGGFLFMLVGSVLFATGTNYGIFLVSRMIMGTGAGVMFLSILKYQSQWFDAKQFGTLTGISTCVANIGGAVSQTPLIFMSERIGWRACFASVAIAAALMAVGTVLFISGSKKARTETTMLDSADEKKQYRNSIFSILKNRYSYTSLLINFIAQGIYVVSITWTISYLCEIHGMSTIRASGVSSLIPIMAAAVSFIAGAMCDKLQGRRKVGVFFSAFVSLALAVPAFIGNGKPPAEAASVALVACGAAVFYSIYYGVIKDVNAPEFSGVATGILNVSTFLGASLFPLFSGFILEKAGRNETGYGMMFRFLFVVAIIATITAFLIPETGMKSRYHEIKEGVFKG